jgi:DNA-binding response OmpR family regulator
MKNTQESKGRILFVNHDPNISEPITLMFKESGYETVIAHSISKGMKIIGEEAFEMFIIDRLFNDGTGLDLCRAIRLVDEQTPILFYLADWQAFELKIAMQAGAQGCLLPPFSSVA